MQSKSEIDAFSEWVEPGSEGGSPYDAGFVGLSLACPYSPPESKRCRNAFLLDDLLVVEVRDLRHLDDDLVLGRGGGHGRVRQPLLPDQGRQAALGALQRHRRGLARGRG